MDEVDYHIYHLKSQDTNMRKQAALKLGEYKDKRATRPLIEALQDSDHHVRHNAAVALGEIYQKQKINPLYVVRALLKAFIRNENVEVRRGISDALGSLPHKAAVPLLISVLLDEEEDTKVRENAAYVLGEIRDPRTIESLIRSLVEFDNMRTYVALAKMGSDILPDAERLLKDKDSDIRLKVLYALEKVNDFRAFELAVECLKDKSPHVRSLAAGILKNIGSIIDFRNISDINELIRLRAKLIALVEKHKDSDFYDKLRDAVSKFLIRINARKNQLLHFDIDLSKPRIKPPQDQGGTYRMRRLAAR